MNNKAKFLDWIETNWRERSSYFINGECVDFDLPDHDDWIQLVVYYRLWKYKYGEVDDE